MIVLRGQVATKTLTLLSLSVLTSSELPGEYHLVQNGDESLSLHHGESNVCLTDELLLPVTLKREKGALPPVEKVVLTRYWPNKGSYGLDVYLEEQEYE